MQDFPQEKCLKIAIRLFAMRDCRNAALILDELPHLIQFSQSASHHIFLVDSKILCFFGPARQRLGGNAAHNRGLPLLSLFFLVLRLLLSGLDHNTPQLLIALFEFLVEAVGRRPLPPLILPHYLFFVGIPLLEMDLIVLGLLH
jgi:hypothetical protein